MSKKSGLMRRLFSGLWRGIRLVCTTFWVMVTLVLVISLVGILANMGETLPEIPDQGALTVSIDGPLVDELAEAQPMDIVIGNDKSGVLLRDWIAAVTAAAEDDRITTLVLKLDSFSGASLSKLQEFGDALQLFKDSGKKIVAAATSYNQPRYYLASFADEIYMHPMGDFSITGMSRTRLYFKDALDKFKVDFHIFKVGTYKDAVEPFMTNQMSLASREHNELLANEQWQAYSQSIEQQRQLPEGTLQQFVENGRQMLVTYQGDVVSQVTDLGFIDGAKNRHEVKQHLIELVGADEEEESYSQIHIANYSRHLQMTTLDRKENRVAVVVAAGEIVDGNAGPGSVGGDTLVKQLKQVRKDDNVKALVLRVDSPGGSAFASELIREELLRIKEKGIPVVVSMGGLAASGGYWISADADEIWATPTTITGSIGVFGMLPSVERILTDLGVNSDQVGSAGAYSEPGLMTGLDDIHGQAIQASVEHIYREFLTLVANGREKTVPEIDKIAQGRVWIGSHALKIGLVDKLGSLNDAIASAAKLAELDEYSVNYSRKETSKTGQLLQALSAKASDDGWLDQQTAQVIDSFWREISKAASFNDPKGIYLYCSDCTHQ